MIIGVPREIKDHEYRVAMVPSGVRTLKEAGHTVVVEKHAGLGSSISDEEFIDAGAELKTSAKEVFSASDMVVKVKEPQPEEFAYFKEGLVLFTFLHLVTKKALAEALCKSAVTSIAYETLEQDCIVPILKPMSEIAGRLSVQIGAQYLMKPNKGRGVLLGGVPGVARGRVLILGSGTVGVNAAKVALGLGAEVTIIDSNVEKFRYLDDTFGGRIETLFSNSLNIEKTVRSSDLLIGAVHLPGAKTPTLVSSGLVKEMKPGSVIVDVAVDQGGCVETIRPTTHSEPVYIVDNVVHYGVTNIPGSVPRTSTFALTNAAFPFVLTLASKGVRSAADEDPGIKKGVNTHKGRITNRAVARGLGMEYVEFSSL